MGQNKNLLLAIAAIFGFFFLWDSMVASRYAKPNKATPKNIPITQASLTTPEPMVLPKGKQLPAVTAETLYFLENSENRVWIAAAGAGIQRWSVKEKSHWVDVINIDTPSAKTMFQTFPDLNFSLVEKDASSALLKADHPLGFRVEKRLALNQKPPFHGFDLRLTNFSKAPLEADMALLLQGGVKRTIVDSPHSKKDDEAAKAEEHAVLYSDRAQRFRAGFIFGRTVNLDIKGPIQWIGADNNHFMATAIDPEGGFNMAHVEADRNQPPMIGTQWASTLAPGQTIQKKLLLYVGPKKYEDLKKFGFHLDAAVNFGFFGPIAKILFLGLERFYKLTGNYGWAIILLTIVVQILVFPLTKKSLRLSVKMKELQPQLKVLQEQFKKDPKRLQIETMNLYKKNGMKLMGMEGCIPMLLQMPIFFALYSTMQVAYELRGAPWIFWIKDLGAKDPYYILPIIMGGGMFLQQKLTSVTTDPAQAKMMMMMPIIFTFMFLQFPSGLVLYWIVNSMMTILIQKLLTAQSAHQHHTPTPA